MEYAKQVQKPILQVRGKDATPRSAALSAKSGPGKSSATRSDIAGRRDAAAAGHHDNAADRHDDAAASHHGDAAQLSAMQQRHEWERRKAAAISNTVHHPDDHATAGQWQPLTTKQANAAPYLIHAYRCKDVQGAAKKSFIVVDKIMLIFFTRGIRWLLVGHRLRLTKADYNGN